MALILATAVWLLIRAHLQSEGMWEDERPLRAIPLTEEQQRELNKKP